MTVGSELTPKKLTKQTAVALMEKSHFTLDQIFNLASIYKTIAKGSKNDKLDRQRFRDDLYKRFRMTDEFLLDRIFKVLDKDNDAYLSLEEWILGMSILLLGTLPEHINFCFSVYNLSIDVSFGRDEMFQLLRKSITRFNTDDDPDEGIRDLIEIILRKIDHDRDGRINFEDFEKSVKSDILYLEIFGNCLPTPETVDHFLEQISVPITD